MNRFKLGDIWTPFGDFKHQTLNTTIFLYYKERNDCQNIYNTNANFFNFLLFGGPII